MHNANSSVFLISTSLSPLYQALRQDQSDQVVQQVQGVHGPHLNQDLPVSQVHPRNKTRDPVTKCETVVFTLFNLKIINCEQLQPGQRIIIIIIIYMWRHMKLIIRDKES